MFRGISIFFLRFREFCCPPRTKNVVPIRGCGPRFESSPLGQSGSQGSWVDDPQHSRAESIVISTFKTSPVGKWIRSHPQPSGHARSEYNSDQRR